MAGVHRRVASNDVATRVTASYEWYVLLGSTCARVGFSMGSCTTGLAARDQISRWSHHVEFEVYCVQLAVLLERDTCPPKRTRRQQRLTIPLPSLDQTMPWSRNARRR
jgi:hypothetical protein